jgi:hypothetical protein
MTQYQSDLQVRVQSKVEQMIRIHLHATELMMNDEPIEKIQPWVAMFDDLEAEVEVLIMLEEVMFN